MSAELHSVPASVVLARRYAFRAVDHIGSMHAGTLEAIGRGAAIEQLNRRRLMPLEICELLENAPVRSSLFGGLEQSFTRTRRSLPQVELQATTQSLAALLGAGLTIDRALQICALLASRPITKQWAAGLLQHVRAGKALSAAFTAGGERLPPYYASMIAAGEAGGTLPEALTRLSELMRRQLEVRERTRSALIYPALLAGVVLLTLVMLLTFVLPRFDALFAESEAPLPWSTRAVLDAGRFVTSYGWVLLLLAAGSIAAFSAWLRSPQGRRTFHRWLLKSRLTLGLPGGIEVARMLRTLSSLCRSGMPLPQALKIARGTLANSCLSDALSRAIADVQAGHTLSQALERAGEFPALAVQLSRVGEETGRLDELLQSAAGVLENDNQTKLERLLTLMVPLLTILMGLLVAGLIGSVLIGLLSINDLAF